MQCEYESLLLLSPFSVNVTARERPNRLRLMIVLEIVVRLLRLSCDSLGNEHKCVQGGRGTGACRVPASSQLNTSVCVIGYGPPMPCRFWPNQLSLMILLGAVVCALRSSCDSFKLASHAKMQRAYESIFLLWLNVADATILARPYQLCVNCRNRMFLSDRRHPSL